MGGQSHLITRIVRIASTIEDKTVRSFNRELCLGNRRRVTYESSQQLQGTLVRRQLLILYFNPPLRE